MMILMRRVRPCKRPLPPSIMIKAASVDDETAEYRIVLHNQPGEVVRVSQWINQAVAPELQLSERLIFRLSLVLEEALTNVIDYAFDTEAPQQITVQLRAGTDTVTVQIIDKGKPFNPLQDHTINLPTNLNEAGRGGLGLHLIRSYTQTCHYQRTDNQNILTLILDRQLT
jgi:serine/threonine-protein kinase RsbW